MIIGRPHLTTRSDQAIWKRLDILGFVPRFSQLLQGVDEIVHNGENIVWSDLLEEQAFLLFRNDLIITKSRLCQRLEAFVSREVANKHPVLIQSTVIQIRGQMRIDKDPPTSIEARRARFLWRSDHYSSLLERLKDWRRNSFTNSQNLAGSI